ncbi:hypothetical protein GCM10025868_14650 [Angustibacter aerolatus]|uniref:Uncharacterized protein n=1 Tax=Angustibacter aerolatus TaxID=1162965 RepID=A0ABQ6JH99_9ACTN|nr:hypothetical protein GCM10025868_14650 [Angustibacter aerolatus]
MLHVPFVALLSTVGPHGGALGDLVRSSPVTRGLYPLAVALAVVLATLGLHAVLIRIGLRPLFAMPDAWRARVLASGRGPRTGAVAPSPSNPGRREASA